VPDHDPLIGEMIGRWRVDRLIGAGGMGRVYLAVQPEIGARVAIKVLRRESLEDAAVVERFFNEARAVNIIHHENIVDVIDLARMPDGAPYIVMEYLEGASLARVFKAGPVALGTLARLVGEVLAALAAAHAKGIVHRDLKPDNVFVSPGGHVRVLDFGIAKLVGEQGPTTTQTGALLGTPAYMAPEQARSQPVDARADLYAVGVILYEGATGTLPFVAGNLFDLLELHVKAAPVAPRTHRPEIPAALEAVILRALAKEPADRFASATQMREALAAATAGLPQGSPRLPTADPVRTPTDPHAATAATTDQSIARGETMPSAQKAPPVRRVFLAGLAGAAVIAAGAAVVGLRPAGHEVAPPPAPPEPAPVLQPDGSFTLSLPHLDSFDVIAEYPTVYDRVEKFARAKIYPYNLEMHGVDRTGRVVAGGHAVYAFESPEFEKRADGRFCLLEVTVEAGKATLRLENFETHGCTEPAIQPPVCSFAQVWKKAVAKGLDPNATDRINLLHRTFDEWLVAVGTYQQWIDDDCR
jgi:hypothetical protein